MENKAFDHSKYRDWIDPNTVKPYERNAKIHDEKQIKNIVNSIKRFGWQQDTAITTDNVLVIGHGRRLAALEIGCEMPYHRIDKEADQLTDEDIRELRIADNQTNAETGFDTDLMALEISDLKFNGFDFDFEAPEVYIDDEGNIKADSDFVYNDRHDGQPPQSKIYICAVSVFGTDAECVCQTALTEEETKKVLDCASSGNTQKIVDGIRGAFNAF